jgi:hypothetical protein
LKPSSASGFQRRASSFKRADVEVAVVEEGFQFRHVLGQEAAVLADAVAAHRALARGT